MFTIVVIVFSVILGNCLGAKVRERQQNESANETESVFVYESVSDIRVNALYFDISELSYVPVSTIERWSALGRTVASVELRGISGNLRYRSELAQTLGFNKDGEIDINLLSETFRENGIYLSGIFCSGATAQNANIAAVYRAYEIGLIGELAESGIGDILITGLNVNPENIDAVTEYLREIRRNVSDVVFGVAVPYSTVSGDGGDYVMYMLDGVCDYIALDFSDVYDDDTLLERINDCVYYISRYDPRILLDSLESGAAEMLASKGLGNWQYIS